MYQEKVTRIQQMKLNPISFVSKEDEVAQSDQYDEYLDLI